MTSTSTWSRILVGLVVVAAGGCAVDEPDDASTVDESAALACATDYAPVCDARGAIYGNACLAAAAGATVDPTCHVVDVSPAIATAHPYANNASSRWTIDAPADAVKVRVELAGFETESGYDFVRVLDASSRQIAAYSGTLGTFVSKEVPGRQVNVSFTSDRTVTMKGFELRRLVYFTAAPAPVTCRTVFASNDPPRAIPDADAAGITSVVDVEDVPSFSAARLSLHVTHPYRGDLVVTLIKDGTSVVLSNRQGTSADDLVITDRALTQLAGVAANGMWKLVVSDRAAVDVGTLDGWSLAFDTTSCAQASCVDLPATCGPSGTASCCASTVVAGGQFNRNGGADPATLSDFRLDTYEVTVGRFRRFVDAGRGTAASPPAPGAGVHTAPSIPGSGWDGTWSGNLAADTAGLKTALRCDADFATWTDAAAGNETRPINCVSWYEAAAFCAWDGGWLPTDAEWYYAATGGAEQRVYPWSAAGAPAAIDESRASYWLDTTHECRGDGVDGCTIDDLVRVGSKPAGNGRWGQADLAGNVWEWSLDWDGRNPTPCTDCASVTSGTQRRLRGGGFHHPAANALTSNVGGLEPTRRAALIGFRCARPR